jgi:hypothetical protein
MANVHDSSRVARRIESHRRHRSAIPRLDHGDEAALRRKVLATYGDALGLSDVA